MISIEQIHSFALVYEHGSYSAAARVANKDRSTIREHIVSLEDLIGVELFEIKGRQAKPTTAAHKLMPRAISLSKQAKDFELTAFSLLDEPLEKLVLLHDDQIPPSYIARSIKAIKKQYPCLMIDCSPCTRELAYERIENDECHIAIMATENTPRTQARIASKYIGNLAISGYAHPDSNLLKADSVSFDDLRLETQFEFPNTNEGDLGYFRISNVVEKISNLDMAISLLRDEGWIVLSAPIASAKEELGLLMPLNFDNATRNYFKGVCLFFGLTSNTREEITYAIDVLNQNAGEVLS
ncbi:LysR family transcriptional regulator [Vibrio diazotrophicus]|uniref:LysR family transcriptional regulator n=1 Tax=Vibrio diazotrophicus TaxID=685 RepID=UPI00142E2018|nr:LysR family transcriptional regulator [Vibrio diazotrophicus]NIY91882.1 LysR family transcriptional regulator [Vibrio diazotrophicus]